MNILCKSANICMKYGINWGKPEQAAPIVCCIADISVAMYIYVSASYSLQYAMVCIS